MRHWNHDDSGIHRWTRDDCSLPIDRAGAAADRPRFTAAGTALGILALVTNGCGFLLWLLTPMPF